MKTKELGNTGYRISVMGFGCGGYWGKSIFNENKAISLVHQAIDSGVNFFDTGSSYSGGNAEVRLGRALKGLDTSKLIIGTKVGTHIKANKLYKDYSHKSICTQVESSLRNLGLDCLPLLQLHGIPKYGVEETMDTMNMLKKQGKILMIGASCDGDALEHILSFNQLDVVMLTYNLIEKNAIKQINAARQKGCGILIKSPMCHTLYSNNIFKIRRVSDIWYLLRVLKNYRHLVLEGFKYRFVNHINEFSSHEVALLYALHDDVSCVVTGTTNSINLKNNIKTFEKELPHALRAQIDHI